MVPGNPPPRFFALCTSFYLSLKTGLNGIETNMTNFTQRAMFEKDKFNFTFGDMKISKILFQFSRLSVHP